MTMHCNKEGKSFEYFVKMINEKMASHRPLFFYEIGVVLLHELKVAQKYFDVHRCRSPAQARLPEVSSANEALPFLTCLKFDQSQSSAQCGGGVDLPINLVCYQKMIALHNTMNIWFINS